MFNINWFPGHMAKTLRELSEQLSRCDYVVETCDSRLPQSSRNPEFVALLAQKRRMILMTKADLADPQVTDEWLDYWRQSGETNLKCVLAIDGRKRSQVNQVQRQILADNQDLIAKAQARGRRIRPIRVMVNGIPNTGKSTLINQLTGKKSAKTANTPGVTRSISWLRAGDKLELMDTPGALWPKFETLQEQLTLAISGAIRDDLLPLKETAGALLMILNQDYPHLLSERYQLHLNRKLFAEWAQAHQILTQTAEALSFLQKGSEPDLMRAARQVLTDFRNGKIGRISLERPNLQLNLPAGDA